MLPAVGKESRHFGAGLEAMLGRELPAIRLRHRPALGDADQRVMRLVIVGRAKIGLIGGDQRDVVRVGEIDQVRLGRALGRQAVALELDVKPVAEDLFERLAA